MIAQDVGEAQRVGRREVRGHRAHGRVQPAVPARRHRRGRHRRGRARDDRPAEAGDAARRRQRRLPVPADAGAHVLTTMLAEPATRSITRVGHLWLDDFRCLQGVDLELAPGLTVIHGANGQGKTSLLEAVGWIAPRAVVPRRARQRRSCAPGASRRSCGPRSSSDERAQLLRGRDPRDGPQPGAVQQAARCTRTRDLLGLLRVTVFAPDDLELVKGGPAERRDYLDDLLGDARRPLRRGARRLRAGAEAAQRAAARAACATTTARATLDVFDEQLVQRRRASWCGAGCSSSSGSCPAVDAAYAALAGDGRPVADDATRPSGRRRRSASPTSDAVDELLRDALGGAPAGRDRPGRHAGRAAPRRWQLHDRRARRADARVAGRAAQRSRSRCASAGPASCTSSPARRRCCCSTTCSASSTRAAPSALVRAPRRRADPAHDRGRGPAGDRARPACCVITPAGSIEADVSP